MNGRTEMLAHRVVAETVTASLVSAMSGHRARTVKLYWVLGARPPKVNIVSVATYSLTPSLTSHDVSLPIANHLIPMESEVI